GAGRARSGRASHRDRSTFILTNWPRAATTGQQGEFEMINNPKIGAIVFYVKDLSRSEKFYRDMLGLQTHVDPGHADADPDHAGPWMRASVGELSLIFFERNEKPGRSPIVVFTLAGGGIDDIVDAPANKGVQI